MTHGHTTAHRVLNAATALGLTRHLHMHKVDVFQLAKEWDDIIASSSDGQCSSATTEKAMFDLLWLDFGIGLGNKWDTFLDVWWPRVRPGGLVLIHSTLTNAATRRWLDSVRLRTGHEADVGCGDEVPRESGAAHCAWSACNEFATVSFLEPHKYFQNSFSAFQKRPDGYAEPVHTIQCLQLLIIVTLVQTEFLELLRRG